MNILAFDPGESTGWFLAKVAESKIVYMRGGTILKPKYQPFANLKAILPPMATIIYERFQLYPGQAKALAWNTFYTCEIIGIIKYLFEDFNLITQEPSCKKFSGGLDADWIAFKTEHPDKLDITEHTKDAFLHVKYYMRNGGRSLCKKQLPSGVQ